MKLKKKIFDLALIYLLHFTFVACSKPATIYPIGTRLSQSGGLEIVRVPTFADYSGFSPVEAMQDFPRYDKTSDDLWQLDVRSTDIARFDLSDRLYDLSYTTFDDKTKWPSKLPKGFDPKQYMQLGKDPGLGIRDLHEKGITGKNVGIAIIDQALLVNHIEYKDQLRLYEEIHWTTSTTEAQMHGPALASIAAGKTVGVAPDADLYFIACWMGDNDSEGRFVFNLSYVAFAIDRIVAINTALPANRKIRVISISLGLNEKMAGYADVMKSIKRAEKAGIKTLFVSSDNFSGAGRDPLADPNNAASWTKGLYWSQYPADARALLIPMDSRCTASPTGDHDYVFYRDGGMSWTVPYVAGLYALACQQKPSVDFADFWKALNATSQPLVRNGENIGKLINPEAMIAKIVDLGN